MKTSFTPFTLRKAALVAAALALAVTACKGDKGDTGPAGANGTNGTNGVNGTNGTNGANGTNGTNGANGTNGTNGVNGTTGPTGPQTVKIIALNDFHGQLQAQNADGIRSLGTVVMADPANAAGTKVPVGGAAYLATLVRQLKSKNPLSTVVAAGDLVGASQVDSLLFHDEPTIEVLNAIGLEYSSVGNHEFDYGMNELLRKQYGGCYPLAADKKTGVIGVDTCVGGPFQGASFKYLSANVIVASSGQPLFPAYAIKQFGIVKVGFIGMTLKATPSVVTPSGVAGLTFNDEVQTVNALIPTMKAQGADAIVVLVHQGGQTTATTINDKTCPNLTGDITPILSGLDPAVDVVISGHTHQEYVCTMPSGLLVTQTGFYGRVVTELDLTIDPATHKVTAKTANNLPVVNEYSVAVTSSPALPAGVTRLTKDPMVNGLVNYFGNLSAPIKNQQEGTITADFTNTPTSTGESTAGDLVADAYLDGTSGAGYTNPAVIAFCNIGGVRTNLTYDANSSPQGLVTFGQLFAVAPFGNNMVTMDLTGAQIVRVLEQQWEAPQPAGGRVMQVSKGLTYTWDSTRPEGAAAGQGARIIASTLKLNGTVIDPAATYRVTVNNFMATGGDNFTGFIAGKNLQTGAVDIDVLINYLKKASPLTPNNTATTPRISKQ